ncbi:MAG: heparinase II/III family protein [Planctomycetes bacterium]|nr:heparinase II/III family protein [Planctomycetota bacterium]
MARSKRGCVARLARLARSGVAILGGLAACLTSSCESGDKVAYASSTEDAAPADAPGSGGGAPGAAGSGGTSDMVLDEPGTGDAPGLQADGVRVVVLSTRSAKVVWTTPHHSDSEVHWGKTPQLEARPILDPAPALQHTVLLEGLEEGQVYFAQAVSRTAGGTAVETDIVRFETLSIADYTVRMSRPRLFFNSVDVPEIKARIAGPNAKAWAALKGACENALAKGSRAIAEGGNVAEYARALAFAGYFGGDSRFRKKAEEVAIECARLGGGGDKMDVRLRVLAVTAVYDWLHGYLSEDVKETLRSGLWAMVERLESDSNDHEYVWGHSHGNSKPMLLAALVLHGDSRAAEERLPGLLRAYRDGFLATWRSYGDDGGSLKGWWYTTWTLNMEVEVLAAVSSATDLDWHGTERWFGRLVDWYLVGLRGDDRFLKSGDTRPGVGFTHFDWVYALSAVHFHKDGRAKWLAEKIAGSIDIWALHNVWAVLWSDGDVAPVAPSGALVRLYGTAGHALFRDGWGPDAVVAGFRSAPDYTLGHTHFDNNSFTVFHRGGLALDSGLYDGFGSSHHLNYSKRSIAHNTILVYDPDERFVYQGKEHANDGGQRWRGASDGIDRSFPATVEDVLDPFEGYRAGGIQVFEDAPGYAYVLGDAAPSYSPAKLSVFDRHFVWLKSIAGRTGPVMVVFDNLVATQAQFRKTYLLHTQNRPAVDGRLVTASNQGGVLFHETLLPEAPRIELVGGAGKEFWVAGRNYEPVRQPVERDDAGSWRVEVTNTRAQQTDRFLHVLHAADAGGSPPRASRIAAAGMVGCSVEDWVVLFGTRKGGVASVRYSVARGSWRCLLLGMAPLAGYDLIVDGAHAGTVAASDKGTVQLDLEGPFTIELVRREGAGA